MGLLETIGQWIGDLTGTHVPDSDVQFEMPTFDGLVKQDVQNFKQNFGLADDASNSALSGSIGLGEGLGNLLTGNADFQRQVALMQAEQAYNSAEAEKAHQRSVALQANSAALERELRQNQYLDTVAGMRAAGLNPALMYGGGSAQLVSSAPPAGGSGARASIGSRSVPHAGAAASMIAGALISAGAMLANSAFTGRIAFGAAPRKIGF